MNKPGFLITSTNGEELHFIEVSNMANSAGVLYNIIQISRKEWFSDAAIGMFVRKLDAMLRFQENFCRDGVDLGDKSPVEIVAIVNNAD